MFVTSDAAIRIKKGVEHRRDVLRRPPEGDSSLLGSSATSSSRFCDSSSNAGNEDAAIIIERYWKWLKGSLTHTFSSALASMEEYVDWKCIPVEFARLKLAEIFTGRNNGF